MGLAFIHYTTLLLDAMCYHGARQNYVSATQCVSRIRKAGADFNDLLQQESEILEKNPNDPLKSYDEHERLAILMEDQEFEISSSYGPYLQYLATTHILCATSLEAHINIQAKEMLEGRYLNDFERISLEIKWLFLPKLLELPGFDPGTEPFQSFSRLVKYRNAIVHYKGRRELWNREGGVPSFLEKLGLTLDAGQASLNTVKNMVETLASQLGKEIPLWLNIQGGGYFKSEFEIR